MVSSDRSMRSNQRRASGADLRFAVGESLASAIVFLVARFVFCPSFGWQQALGHSTRMAHSRETRAAQIQDSIRQVLLRDWNPIGCGDPLPEDEYDRYIAPVYRILVGSRSEQELIDLLFHTERDTIGVSCESPEQ